jgi:hypothetical protein
MLRDPHFAGLVCSEMACRLVYTRDIGPKTRSAICHLKLQATYEAQIKHFQNIAAEQKKIATIFGDTPRVAQHRRGKHDMKKAHGGAKKVTKEPNWEAHLVVPSAKARCTLCYIVLTF